MFFYFEDWHISVNFLHLLLSRNRHLLFKLSEKLEKTYSQGDLTIACAMANCIVVYLSNHLIFQTNKDSSVVQILLSKGGGLLWVYIVMVIHPFQIRAVSNCSQIPSGQDKECFVKKILWASDEKWPQANFIVQHETMWAIVIERQRENKPLPNSCIIEISSNKTCVEPSSGFKQETFLI